MTFSDSRTYWERRYSSAGTSGTGSYGHLAEFKAEILNRFCREQNIESVIELGSGDGNQLTLLNYKEYLGFDVSETAIARCRERFSDDPNKSFLHINDYSNEQADLSLSLDVIYHLVEDDSFHNHMTLLFNTARRFVVIYSSNSPMPQWDTAHVRHRCFTDWIAANRPQWELQHHIANRYPFVADPDTGSHADFYIFRAAHESHGEIAVAEQTNSHHTSGPSSSNA